MVIDVLRACTTAAAALAAGAREIVVAATVEEAFALSRRLGGAPIAGEVNGFAVPGFDFTNSPVALAAADLEGRQLVLRTTAGTQGLVRAAPAGLVLAAGFVTAGATVTALLAASPARVTFVVTGSASADRGEEDRALADYLDARLRGERPDPGTFLERARRSAAAARFLPGGDLEADARDLDACLDLDRHGFAVRLEAAGELLRLRPHRIERRAIAPEGVVVREIVPAEHEALARVTVGAYRALGGGLGDYESELRDVDGRAAGAVVLVAVVDGEVAGGVTYVPDPASPYAEFDDPGGAGIRMLAVDPAFQGRGVGRALVLACLDRARAGARRRVVLHSTEAMQAAQRLYRTLGFRRAPDLDWDPTPEVHLTAYAYDLGGDPSRTGGVA